MSIERYTIKFPHFEPFQALLVDTLPANHWPAMTKVAKYYGRDYPLGAYQPRKVDRWVFRKEDGSYVVLPDTPMNRKYILSAPPHGRIKLKGK